MCTVLVAIEMFRSLGYEVCRGDEPESGYNKIAIYGDKGDYTHAARQLDNGSWTSKLGHWEDIEHKELNGLVGTEYGKVAAIMRKPKHSGAPS